MKMTTFQSHPGTQQAYDRLSRWYDLFSAGERSIQHRALAVLDPHPGESILEIGCGTGHLLSQVAGRLAGQGRATGVDLSVEMARIAQGRLRKGAAIHSGSLSQADALYLPFCADAFDALISTFTLELFEMAEIAQVLKECRRVLKPGSRLVAATLNQPAGSNRAVMIYNWFHLTFPRLVDCRPVPLAQLLGAAGFEIASLADFNLWGLPVRVAVGLKPF